MASSSTYATPSHSAEHATHTQGDTKKRELLKCVVAVKECIRGGGRHLHDVIFKHWSFGLLSLKRQVVMVQFLSIIFFSWISSIFVGVFKSSCFFVSLCTCSAASDLTSPLTGTAGDVLSDIPFTSLAYKSPKVALNLDISAKLCCLMSWISPKTVLNLLSAYFLDLLISWLKLSIVTPICSLCS